MFPVGVLFKEKLISPAQAEVLMKDRATQQKSWDRFATLIRRPEGSLTLAPETDERPAIDPATEAAEHFDAPGEELL